MTFPFIMAAPNGARRDKTDHPALPLTLSEIVDTAVACHAAGADGLHLHIRDDTGAHSLDPGRYKETLVELNHTAPNLDVQITTEAAGVFDVPAQLECLQKVQPKWASISIREIARDPDLARRVYGTCVENGTRVQHIFYDAQDQMQLLKWQAEGVVPEDQADVLFVLGRYLTTRHSQPSDLDPFLAADLSTARWMVCAFGVSEHTCLTHAARLGGDLRVGFENSLSAPDGTIWPDCAASVAALRLSLVQSLKPSAPIEG